MKIPRQRKLFSLTIFLSFSSFYTFGQNAPFIPDAKKDSIEIQQALKINNKLHPIKSDSNNTAQKQWIAGKIVYSTDGLLKAVQLVADSNTFTTTIIYHYHGKILKQDLNYNADFSNYTLNKIYKLPGKTPGYLFLLCQIENNPDYLHNWLTDYSKTSNLPDNKDFKHIKKVRYIASAFRLDKDSLFETTFPLTTAQAADTANLENSKSFGFIADVKQSKESPKPFLKYDELTNKLRFLNISYKTNEINDTSAFMNVESAAFQYRDTSFVLLNDTTYYYPSLASTKVIARRNYKAGKYIIKAVAYSGYQDFDGDIWPVLATSYQIGTQTLSINNDGYDDGNKVDLKPDYRLQNNTSLILLLTDHTNNHAPGMCGSADYFDSNFWLINDNKAPTQLFAFSYGSCNLSVSYTFNQNGKEISGNFYLNNRSDTDDITVDNSYWANNSTYVFVVGNENNLSRKFYLHFNPLNKKAPVTLRAGKLNGAKKKLLQ